jgi:hypothetical protein
MNQTRAGGCMCGAFRFRASGPPKWIVWCHCQSCRKHSGAPASTYVCFDESAIEVTKGEITKFASSAPALRGFCSTCGSTLTAQVDYMPGELHFHIGAFDEPELLAPVGAAFVEERLPWFHHPVPQIEVPARDADPAPQTARIDR